MKDWKPLKIWEVCLCMLIAVIFMYMCGQQLKAEIGIDEQKIAEPIKNMKPAIKIPSEMDMEIIADIESSGNPDTPDSPEGARGLCQIMPRTWAECTKRMGVEWSFEIDAHDGEKSLAVGTWYMNYRIPQMLNYYKIEDTYENRIISYSWGIGKLRQYKSGKIKKLKKETADYLVKYRTRYMRKYYPPE